MQVVIAVHCHKVPCDTVLPGLTTLTEMKCNLFLRVHPKSYVSFLMSITILRLRTMDSDFSRAVRADTVWLRQGMFYSDFTFVHQILRTPYSATSSEQLAQVSAMKPQFLAVVSRGNQYFRNVSRAKITFY